MGAGRDVLFRVGLDAIHKILPAPIKSLGEGRELVAQRDEGWFGLFVELPNSLPKPEVDEGTAGNRLGVCNSIQPIPFAGLDW